MEKKIKKEQKDAIIAFKQMYDGFIKAGFTEVQASNLLAKIIAEMGDKKNGKEI